MSRKRIIILIFVGVLLLVGVTTAVLAWEGATRQPWENSHDVKKPAVYLYPETDLQVQVHLDVDGELTVTEPDYGDGWEVLVSEDGLIDGQYDYLFYEMRLKSLTLPDSGWIVEYSQLEPWFDVNLGLLGLNPYEAAEFKEYWLGKLPQSAYYEVKLLTTDFLEDHMTLEIDPQPDTIIRLIFCFSPLSQATYIDEPEVVTPIRKGFTVVEWGGILEQ